MENEAEKFRFEKLAESWVAPIVARTDVGKFSGGILHPRTMANLDSKGCGPRKIMIGNRVAYEVKSLIEWMQDRPERRRGSDD